MGTQVQMHLLRLRLRSRDDVSLLVVEDWLGFHSCGARGSPRGAPSKPPSQPQSEARPSQAAHERNDPPLVHRVRHEFGPY